MTQKGGGIAYALRDLVAALGANQEIHSLDDEGDKLDGETGQAHCIDHRFPIAQSHSLVTTLKESNSRLFHTHGLWSAPSIAVPTAAQKVGTPWLVSPHGMLDPWALKNSRWKKKIASLLFEKNHLAGASCLHALCEEETAAIRNYGLKQPIALIPNGVSLPDNFPARKETDQKTLLFLGRLHPKKGLPELLRAWKKLQPAQWNLLIAGWDEGGHEAELRELAKEQTSITFAGPAFGDDKAALFREADAFILPSFSEGLPMAVLEAWSWGLPVFMTHHCHLSEGFAAGAAARIDHDDFCRSLTDALAEDLLTMGKKGRHLAESRFSWEQIAGQMKAVYQWLLGEGAQPGCIR